MATHLIQHSFSQYLSNTYPLLGTVLTTKDVMVNKTNPCPRVYNFMWKAVTVQCDDYDKIKHRTSILKELIPKVRS